MNDVKTFFARLWKKTWKPYVIFTAVLLVLAIAALIYVGALVSEYSAAQPEKAVAEAISELKQITEELTVVFMPHTYSRTKSFFEDFARALSLADRCILLDIYPAREQPIDGVSSQALAQAVGGGCIAVGETRCASVLGSIDRGAIALLGAGNMDRLFSELALLK